MKAEYPLSRSVWITSAVSGITVAVGGFHHGLFEVLQGNAATRATNEADEPAQGQGG